VLDAAIADTKAEVRFVAYDLNQPEIVNRIIKLKKRVRIIIDNHSTDHGKKGSAENQTEVKLDKSAGKDNVLRQHMGNIQHNKFIAVMGPKAKLAVCGSTNFSWRAFFVQNNNAVILQGKDAVQPFFDAFDNYWNHTNNVRGFGATQSARWTNLNLKSVNAKVAFSPHIAANALLQDIGDDIKKSSSSLLYSLAFLAQTGGAVRDALKTVSNNNKIFVYGISDRKAGGIVVRKPDGNLAPVFPAALTKGLPEPFKSEPTAGKGVRMHHKFTVIDFDKPTARVYLGSYNFSNPVDLKNGENLLLIRDRQVRCRRR
jgi:phosphatidylserine/phosphatidylglycerophosphate/cardiolipin synthase-like enzyme